MRQEMISIAKTGARTSVVAPVIDAQAMAIAHGIVAAYLLVVVVATSWPRLRFRRRVWRMLHLLSIPAGVLTVLHALQAGSDGQTRSLQLLLAVLGGAFFYPAVLRLLHVRRRTKHPIPSRSTQATTS